jgi:uncharacterized repeat protein (TIGR01451 family)
VESDDQHIVLEWSAPPYEVSRQSLDGQAVDRVSVPGCPPAGQPGEPELPACTTLLGVPPDAQLTLRILEQETVPVPGAFSLPPQPEPVVEEPLPPETNHLPQIVGERRIAGPAYAQDAPFPPQPASLGEPAFLRHQRLVAVSFFPLQYRPQGSELLYHTRLRLEIALGGVQQPMSYVAEPPAFERVLANTLLNYTQARNWRQTTPLQFGLPPVPPSPGWRIPVSRAGIYELSYSRLQAAGLPVDTLDPRTLRLLRYGQEVPIRVLGEEDGHFDPGDRVLFYGRPLTGSFFTDAEVYWLTYGGSAGLRMARRDGTPHGTANVPPDLAATEHIEQNPLYLPNLPARGDHDHWLWNLTFPEGGNFTQTYSFPAHALSSGPYTVTLRVYLFGMTRDDKVDPDHHVRFLLNGTLIDELWWDGQIDLTPTLSLPSSLLQPSGNTVEINSPGDTGAFAEIAVYDWLELDERRLFVAEGNTLRWKGEPGRWEYHLASFTSPEVMLLDVSDPDNPSEIVSATVVPMTTTYKLSFEESVTKTTTYWAEARAAFQEPASIEAAAPADLRDPANRADYVVITHRDFYTQALSLATLRAGQGLRTLVVDVADAYDMFAYGRQVPEAIHDMLAYAYAGWSQPAPTYVVLLGDGHYDPKGHLGYPTRELILPYLAWADPWLGQTAADNRYVCLSGADYLPDMLLGRLPANSPAEAQSMVDKIIAYESSPPTGEWRQRALFAADNADQAGDFAALSEALIAGYYSAPYTATRVYLGITCPQGDPSVCHNQVLTAINEGLLLVNYIGHGGTRTWAEEHLLYLYDLGSLSNGPYLPVALPMTCYEGYYIDPSPSLADFALAEVYLRTSSKGWIASWSPTGLGVATGHDYLDRGFLQAVFQDDERQLGPATMAGNLRLWASGHNLDLLDTYLLLGDPALEMPLLETDLSLDKAVAPTTPLQPGDPVTFTLSLAAAGPATAHHVVLTDTLSPYLVSPTVYAAGITLTQRPGTGSVWDVADMAAGRSGTVTVTAHLSWLTPAGLLVNQARVATSAKETDLQNNADLASWQVVPGPPYTVVVVADPPALPADGSSLSQLRAHVVDTAGNPVADGTPVAFATDAGTFSEGSTYYTTTTAQGDAAVFLRAADQVVTATVTVTSVQAVGQIVVPFVSMAPHTVLVVAVPSAIPMTGTAQITTTVLDVLGHPVQDGTGVTLTATLGTLTTTAGATRGGIVTSTLSGDGQAGLATIVARSGDVAGAAAVRIGSGSSYTLTLVVTPAALPADGASQAIVTATLARADGRPITGTHWVTFNTTLGTVTPTVCTAISGTATATLTAATRTGTALVVATAERESDFATVTFLPGPAALLTLTVSPASIPVGGASAVAVAAVHDTYGNPVADGTPVSFGLDLGTISPTVGATHAGQARAVLLSGTTAGTATVAAQAGPASDTATVRFTTLEPFTVTLTASPTAVVADGQSAALLAAWVSDRYGNPVEDGTGVDFHTTLGTLWPPQAGTVQGWATAALTSTAVGTATVQCYAGFAGNAQDQVTVRFIAGPPAMILVMANPARIYADGISTATVTAYVWDAWNHPVADGTLVTMSSSLGEITPAVVPANDGQAGATLRSSAEPGWAVVQARSGPAGGEVRVEFFQYRVYLPLAFKAGPQGGFLRGVTFRGRNPPVTWTYSD